MNSHSTVVSAASEFWIRNYGPTRNKGSSDFVRFNLQFPPIKVPRRLISVQGCCALVSTFVIDQLLFGAFNVKRSTRPGQSNASDWNFRFILVIIMTL